MLGITKHFSSFRYLTADTGFTQLLRVYLTHSWFGGVKYLDVYFSRYISFHPSKLQATAPGFCWKNETRNGKVYNFQWRSYPVNSTSKHMFPESQKTYWCVSRRGLGEWDDGYWLMVRSFPPSVYRTSQVIHTPIRGLRMANSSPKITKFSDPKWNIPSMILWQTIMGPRVLHRLSISFPHLSI